MKAGLTILCYLMLHSSFSQVQLHITVINEHQVITPAMVCITDINSLQTYIPPGILTPEPSYPDTFYTGIAFTHSKNFTGPVRKMKGKGAVNGQRTYVYGNSPTLPYWSEPVIYQTTGDFEINLPKGKYRVSVEHGNEYIPIQEIITLSGNTPSIKRKLMLKRWINLPELGWYSGDVHTHHPLNKEQFRQYAMQLTKAEDLHLMNVLQMGDRSAVYFQPQGYGEKYHISEKDFCVVTGQEEPRSEYGHIIGLNIDTLARDTARYNYYDLVFDRLHQNPETLVGFAHFAYGGEGVIPGLAMYAPTGAVDFLELMQNTKINTADYYEYLNLGFRFSAAYGSDFPWGSTVGDGRVFVYTGKDFSAGKWFAGLKAGHSFVSNGPALFLEADHKIPGSELIKSANERTQITIRALSSHAIGTIEKIELYGSNGLIAKKKNIHKKEELGLTLNYPVKNSQWITAMVYCSNGAIAHTSPIYFVVDGQSTYNRIKGPGIIGKLTKILLKTRAAETGKPVPDTGILRRIDQAIGWYEQLLQKN